MRRSVSVMVAGLAGAALLAGCGDVPGVELGTDESEVERPTEREQPPEPDDASEAPGFGDFDRDEARERASAFLGVAEDDIEQAEMLRIVRRGDEELPVTMDLRPGRLNLELDDDGSGTYRVTRVVVEVPDGDDPLVVE